MSKSNFGARLVASISAILVTVLLGLGINYLALPAMTFHSSGFWWFCLGMGIIGAVLYFIANGIANYVTCEEGGYVPGFVVGGIAAVWLVVFIITAIACGAITNAPEYSKVVTVEEGNFKEDIKEIDLNDIVVIDVKTAQKLGDRTIANIPNAPWYDVDDEYNLVVINGEKYRISPVNYGSVWKYFKADETGIPGYVLVEANKKDAEAKYVELEEPMRYSPSACFSYDLRRHLRGLYPNHIFGKSFFEVDDAGTPYWITSVKTPQIGLRGALITTSAVVTNAVTGETEEYSLDSLPDWIDHVESVDELMQSLDWHYSYKGGWWNSVTSKTNVYKTTYYYKDREQTESQDEKKTDLAANEFTPFEGYNSIVKDGKVMFYTGLTPANKAESNLGFLLIDPRTREFYYYEAKGAEESSAQGAVEGLVSDFRYSASFPTIVNVDGLETYFMVLKDSAGLIQRFAFANVKNYTKCVQAETIEKALEAYKIKMGLISGNISDGNNNNQLEQNPDVETVSLSGNVLKVEEAQIGGYTYYYFTIEGADAFVFMSSIVNSNQQPMKLQAGSKVTIQYYESQKESGIGIVTSIKFE